MERETSDVSLTCSTIVKNNSPRSEIFHNNETLLDENARSVAFSARKLMRKFSPFA